MFSRNSQDNERCTGIRPHLLEYIDNTLPARRAWEIEKHLTGCGSCSQEVREMQATVQLLHAAPRLDTSDHFMASLHARLDTVDPSAIPGLSVWQRVQGWFSIAGGPLYRHRVPALSLGLAA